MPPRPRSVAGGGHLPYVAGMSEDRDSPMLAILKDLPGKVARIDRNAEDLRLQFGNMSAGLSAVKRDGLRQDEAIAHPHIRQDRMESAIARINARLGLIDTDA